VTPSQESLNRKALCQFQGFVNAFTFYLKTVLLSYWRFPGSTTQSLNALKKRKEKIAVMSLILKFRKGSYFQTFLRKQKDYKLT